MARCPDGPMSRSQAFLTLAHLAQIVPGINPAGMSVIPVEAQGIPAYRLHFSGLHRFLVHRQQLRGLFHRLAGLPSRLLAFFIAGSAWARVPKPLKTVLGPVTVIPFNVHSGTGGHVHFHRFRGREAHEFQYKGCRRQHPPAVAQLAKHL